MKQMPVTSRTPAYARRWARVLAATVVCCTVSLLPARESLAQSSQGPTRHIDTVTIPGGKATAQKFSGHSKEFRADSRDGPVWLVYYFIGELQGAEGDAEVGFEMFFDGVKMDVRDTFALFRARYMQPVREEDVAPGARGTQVALAAWASMPSVPEALAASLGSQAAQSITADTRAYARLRHVVATNRVSVPAGEDTFASFTVTRATGFKPLYLRVHIGQGPIPRELEQWSRQTSGSWLYRYRYAVLMFAVFIGGGLFVLWRLVRRG